MKLPVTKIAREFGLTYEIVVGRLQRGHTWEDALTLTDARLSGAYHEPKLKEGNHERLTFYSIAKSFGIPATTLENRIMRGTPWKEALIKTTRGTHNDKSTDE